MPLLPLHDHHLLRLRLFPTVLVELTHIQVTSARHPFLGLLDCQGRNQSQARLAVGEDPHHPRAALYLLTETFEAVCGADAPAMALREGQARKALLEMLLYVLGYLLVALLAPLPSHARSELEGLLPSRCGEDGPEVCPKLL